MLFIALSKLRAEMGTGPLSRPGGGGRHRGRRDGAPRKAGQSIDDLQYQGRHRLTDAGSLPGDCLAGDGRADSCVCVVDANLQFGDVSIFHDVAAHPHPGRSGTPTQDWMRSVEKHPVPPTSGVQVLVAPVAEDAEVFTEGALKIAAPIARSRPSEHYPLSFDSSSWTRPMHRCDPLAALDVSDLVMVVTRPVIRNSGGAPFIDCCEMDYTMDRIALIINGVDN
jgi:hypothetical protein